MSTKNEKTVTQQLSEFVKHSLDANPQAQCGAHANMVAGIKLCVDIGQENSAKLDKVLEVIGDRKADSSSQASVNYKGFKLSGPWQIIALTVILIVVASSGIGGAYAVTKLFLDKPTAPAKP